MRIEGTRFGCIEVDEAKLIEIPSGLIGFPNDTRFALHEHERSRYIAWLQSVTNPNLAFPVMDGNAFGPDYPHPTADELASSAGIDSADLAVLVVVVPRAEAPRLVANLLAPIIIDVPNRRGVQVVLDPRKFSARHVVGEIGPRITVQMMPAAALPTDEHEIAETPGE
jgi:flagellar assembly factor FliW